MKSVEKCVDAGRVFKLALWITAGVVAGLILIRLATGARLVELVSLPRMTPVPTRPKEPGDGGSGHPYCGDLHADVGDDRILFDEDDYCSYRLVELDETDEFTARIVRSKHLIAFSKKVELYDCTNGVQRGYVESEDLRLYTTEDGRFIECGIAW